MNNIIAFCLVARDNVYMYVDSEEVMSAYNS